MKNNKGYSLVDLIIVVAIISILGAGMAMSVSVIYNSNAKACANSLRDTIADIKVLSMSKGSNSVRVNIFKDTDGYLYTQQEMKDSSGHWDKYGDLNKIGKKRVDVTYVIDGSGTETPLADGATGIYLSFDRASGAFTNKVDGTIIPKQIVVRGGNSVYRLILHDLTGKVEIE